MIYQNIKMWNSFSHHFVIVAIYYGFTEVTGFSEILNINQKQTKYCSFGNTSVMKSFNLENGQWVYVRYVQDIFIN